MSLLSLPLPLQWTPQPFCFQMGPSWPFLKHGCWWIFPSGAPERWFCRELHGRARGAGSIPHTYPRHCLVHGNSVTGPLRKFTSISVPRSSPPQHSNGIPVPVGHTLVLNQCLHRKLLSIGFSALFLQSNLPSFPGQQTGSRKSGKCLTHGFLET